MAKQRTTPQAPSSSEVILTLPEAAALLRVEERPLAELAAQGTVPAQRIGDEWRFLESALLDWLRFGARFPDSFRLRQGSEVWALMADKLFFLLEQRRERVESEPSPRPRRGSKEAINRHVGSLAGEEDLDEFLATLARLRNGDVGEGGE